MTKEALGNFKLSRNVFENQHIAAEVLLRCEQGRPIRDAIEDIVDDRNLFPSLGEDAIFKRWLQWRKYAEGFNGNYYLSGPEPFQSGKVHVHLVPDSCLHLIPDARPLPPASGGRPKGRKNTIKN